LQRTLRFGSPLVLVALVLSMFALPAAASVDSGTGDGGSSRLLSRVSQSVVVRYQQSHSGQAFGERLQSTRDITATVGARAMAPLAPSLVAGVGILFNRDNTGLPQNEESVTACSTAADSQQQDGFPNIVLGGTNDYRGLFDPQQNFTGWHFSNTGGASVTKEGLLPPVTIAGAQVPSGGDPVDASDASCNLYAASLNYDPVNTFTAPNGVGVYRTTPATLAACPGGTATSCWPTRRAVATSQPNHFLDKEWMYVGKSGTAGTVVWVTYTDFVGIATATDADDAASIKAVRCNATLTACTAPILISGDDRDVQFSDVTIGTDGRVYITWSEIVGELSGEPQTFVHKLRVAQAGSTTFGPERVVYREANAIPFDGYLNANDFRIATYPKNDVRVINGRPRVFVVWDACTRRPFGFICEQPVVKLKTSDDFGQTWSANQVVSAAGGNYFPTISNDRTGAYVAISYYTNRYDPIFQNRQDVELVALNPATKAVAGRRRLTAVSNEPEADPLLGGTFIGDYIEVFAINGRAYVHYNANYRQIQLLGQGLPVPQQDNFLIRTALP
jgi:hypothetical protein